MARHKPIYPATDIRCGFKLFDIDATGIILSIQGSMNVLIRLQGCSGWSESSLCVKSKHKFCQEMIHLQYKVDGYFLGLFDT